MAIAFDTATSSQGDPVTSLTFAHTCTGSNRILFVSSATVGGDFCTSVAYAGVALTKIGASVQLPSTTTYVQMWYLIAPATGANNVVTSYSSATNAYADAASYTGANQSGQPDASTTNTNAASTSITTALVSVADNCWHVYSGFTNGGGQAAGTGSTLRVNNNNAIGFYDSNSAKTPPGSVSMTINCNSGTNGVVMASFSPVSVAPPVSVSGNGSLLLMGVGN